MRQEGQLPMIQRTSAGLVTIVLVAALPLAGADPKADRPPVTGGLCSA